MRLSLLITVIIRALRARVFFIQSARLPGFFPSVLDTVSAVPFSSFSIRFRALQRLGLAGGGGLEKGLLVLHILSGMWGMPQIPLSLNNKNRSPCWLSTCAEENVHGFHAGL
jgi:hypothetical protein